MRHHHIDPLTGARWRLRRVECAITKREVWEAYKRVKANRGAAGVDGVSISEFDQDLSKNLYRIWNRMASGSYFPPPVKRVDIPKDDGRTRPLVLLCQ